MIPKIVFVLMLALRDDPGEHMGIVTVYATKTECLDAMKVKETSFDTDNHFYAFCVQYSLDPIDPQHKSD